MKIHLKLQQNIDCSHKDGKAKNETRIFRSDFRGKDKIQWIFFEGWRTFFRGGEMVSHGDSTVK